MSDTEKKDNDTNIESKVPGEQEVRGVSASETNISQAEGTSETDFHYEPVITVTKKEASFTKGDLKLQKISVTEDISDKTKNETIINEVQIITDKDGACEVTHTQTIETVKKVENTTPTREIEKQQDEKKPRTKIPMSKLRRAIKKITEERKKYEEAERQKMSAQQRKSSIPRLKHTVVTATTSKEEARTVSPRTDEEFDKLFEEIVVNQSADESPLIKDPEKLDSKFEELIHAYDENKIEPISIDRVKTRIPMLKRKSEHEIDMSKYSERRRNASLKKRGSVDSSTHNSSTTMHVKESKIQSQTIQKTFTQQTTKLQSETKTTQQQSSKIAVNNSQDNQEKIISSKAVKETTQIAKTIRQSSDNNEHVNIENEEVSETHLTNNENSEDPNESVNSTNNNENTKIFKKSSSIDNSRTTNFNNEETNTKTLHKTIQRTVSEQHTSSITSTNISSNISQTKEITTTEITNNNNGDTIKAIITVERENIASEVPMISNESDKTINDSKTTQHVTNEESNQSSVNSNMQNSIDNQKVSNKVELVQENAKDNLSDENTNVSVEICEIINDSQDPKDKRDDSGTNNIKEISETNIEVKESAADSKSNIEEIAADNNVISIETKEENENTNDKEMSKQDSISIVTVNEDIQKVKSESNAVPEVKKETNTCKSDIQVIATDNSNITIETRDENQNKNDKEINKHDSISIVAGNEDIQKVKLESNAVPEVKEETNTCKSDIQVIATDNSNITIETRNENQNKNDKEINKHDSISIVTVNEDIQKVKSELNAVPEVNEETNTRKSHIQEIATDNNIIPTETTEDSKNMIDKEISKQDSIDIVADNEDKQEEKLESTIVPEVKEETNTCKPDIQEIATDNNIISIKTTEDGKNMIDKEISKQDSISIETGNVENKEEKSESNKDPEIKEEIKITIKQTDTSEEKESSTHVEYSKTIINEESNADLNETNDKDATGVYSNDFHENTNECSSIDKNNIINNTENKEISISQIESLEKNVLASEDPGHLKTEDTEIRNVESDIAQEKEAKTRADSSNKSANYLDVSVSMVKRVVTQHKLNDKTNNNTEEHYLDIVDEKKSKEVVEGEKDEKSPEACINNINKIPETTAKQVSQNLPNTLPEKSDSTLTSVEESLDSKFNAGATTFNSKEEKRVIEKTISTDENIICENKIIESISETKTQVVTEIDEKPQKTINQSQDKDNTNLTDNNITRQVNITQNVNISTESSSINDSFMEKEFVSKAYEETKTTLTTQNILEKKVTESETITTKVKEVLEKTNDSYDDLKVIKRESKGFDSDKSPINITIDKTLIRPATPVIDISPSCIDGKEKEIIISNDNLSNKDVTEHYFKEASHTRVNNASNIIDSIVGNKERNEKVVLDKSMINELLKSDLQEEDIIILRGKVNRVMSRLDSINSKKTNIQQETVDEVPKRTVLSKIAIFERKEVEEKPLYRRIPRSQSHGPSLRHKPKIVEEVLKTTSKMENNVNISRTEVYNKQHSHNLSRNLINNHKSEDIVNKLTSSQNNLDFEKDTNNSENIVISDGRKYSSLKSLNNDELNYEDNSKTIKVSFKERDNKKEVSYAEIDLGDAVKGKVQNVVRMISMERMDLEKKGIIDIKEKPKRGTVLEKIALFEKKSTPVRVESRNKPKDQSKTVSEEKMNEEELRLKIEELRGAKRKYGRYTDLKFVELNDGSKMPAIGLGTALLSKNLTKHIVSAAIDLGYRTIDTAYIYGNEKEIGEAINEKIKDGTVQREDLFVISKLWSTFHRKDLVEKACKMSLKTMGLDYFDLYMIHNPMSFKEGDDPLPKIANVIQYSDSDYLDAWYGVEHVIRKGLARRGGVSNFNSAQVDRIVDKGKLKPVVNQVECHPYLTQQRLDDFCQTRDVKLNCYGVLGSKGTPIEYKSGLTPVIDDPMVLVMAAGLNVTPAQLLISYQLHVGHSVIVKSSTGAHLWSNLLAQDVRLETSHIEALNAMNRNKRNFLFKGMGDTHRNYPFRIPF
ncbi:unnamed protein product [Colias eurytheme]|nr:unnamed protein product [Colias eurytheme]